MQQKQTLPFFTKKYLPLTLGALLALVLIGVVVCWYYAPHKPVAFSYARTQTCFGQLTLMPALQQAHSEQFEVELKGQHAIGNWVYATTETCITPKALLQPGAYTVAQAPFRLPFAWRVRAVQVAEAPSVQAHTLERAKVSTATPLQIPLSAPDKVHTYLLSADAKQVTCVTEATHLSCPVARLGLKQATSYKAQLVRSIGERTDSHTLFTATLHTADPLHFKEASITENQVLYDTVNTFSATFAHSLTTADMSLKTESGKEVQGEVSLSGPTATFSATADLARDTKYVLEITQAVAEDGSSLAGPVRLPFALSGGPKVAAVSVGASGVAQQAHIILTFDQPLHESVSITSVLRVVGVNASVHKQSATQVSITLHDAPLCTVFTLQLAKGLKSGSNEALSAEPWSFTSRVTCGYAQTIGASVKGRPLVAHYFGNGPNTILFTGGIHGSEPSSVTTMQAFVTYLYANGEKIPQGWRVVVVPNVNPDGIATGQRYNANNVNLDRNFPASNWKADIEAASGVVVNGGGVAPLSEPEARAFAALTRQLQPRLAVSFHAKGSLVGSNSVGNADTLARLYASLVGYGTMVGNAEAVMGYPITGEYEDWIGEELGSPAILIELPTYSGNYLQAHLTALLRMMG